MMNYILAFLVRYALYMVLLPAMIIAFPAMGAKFSRAGTFSIVRESRRTDLRDNGVLHCLGTGVSSHLESAVA